MANQKKKRQPVDAWIWNVFVEACGNRCGVCGEVKVTLERGHRISKATDGPDGYDNLIPVCKICNKRHLKKETPDNYRPADYLERFFLLLGHNLRPQISVNTSNGLSRLIPGTEVTENKSVISWTDPQNSLRTEVFTQSSSLTRREAETLVGNAVYWARENKVPRPNHPFEVHATELTRLAMKHGREIFMTAIKAFLRDEPWRISGTEAGVHHDSWAAVASNLGFKHYLRLGREQQAAQAKAVERQRQATAEAVKRHEVEELRSALLTGLVRVHEDWLADPDNRERREDIRKRVQDATPEQLHMLTDEACTLALDAKKWLDGLPATIDDDF
jgi:hypothetical protein